MVRLLKRLVPINKIVGIAMLLGVLGFSLIQFMFPSPASAATTVITSSQAGDSVRYLSLPAYRAQIGSITWPTRTPTCAASATTSYKTLPWLSSDPAGYNGDSMTASGDCSTRFQDGGWASGGWLSPTWSNWATDGSHTLSGTAVGGSSNKAFCYGGAARIWGAAQDNTPIDIDMFTANGYASYTPNSYRLYSRGVTLFRKQFTLTQAQYDEMMLSGNSINMRAVADDWMRVYVNGNLVSTQTDSATSVDFQVPKNYLRVGANNVAFQVADKAVWSTDANNPARGAALCYALTLDTVSVPPPSNAATCTVTSINPATVTPGQTVAAFDARISYTVTSGSFVPRFTLTMSGSSPGSYTVTNGSTVGVGSYNRLVGPFGNSPTPAVTFPATTGTYPISVAIFDNATNTQLATCSTSIVVGTPPPPPTVRKLGSWDTITNLPPVL